MSLSQTERDLEENLRKIEFQILSPDQKHADLNKIQQVIGTYSSHNNKRRFTFITLGSATAIILAYGLIKMAPGLHRTMGIVPKPPTITASTPVPPSALSNDAYLLWRNGTATHAFVTYDGYFYTATGQLINKEDELGQELGKIERLGDDGKPWVNFESNYFPSGTLFAIQRTSSTDKIAVQFWTDSKKGSSYGIFKRDTPLAQTNPNSITGAKNNKLNTSIVLQNIREQFSQFYQLQSNEDSIQEIVLEPSYGPGARITYKLPSGQYLYVFEYKKGLGNDNVTVPNSSLMKNGTTTNLTAQKTFNLNGIFWSYYNEDIIRGEHGDYYYEIDQSGLNLEQEMEILKAFKSQ